MGDPERRAAERAEGRELGHRFAEIAFTPAVRARQAERGSRGSYARFDEGPPWNHLLEAREREFIARRDGFYLASVGETGWPYVQFRGGPPGFLRVLDDHTLGFADLRGNRQYVTLGNISGNDRISLFLMDYPNRRRLKILGRARVVEVSADAELAARLAVPGAPGVVERAVLVGVEAFDWNCPQHIEPRWSRAELEALGLRPPE